MEISYYSEMLTNLAAKKKHSMNILDVHVSEARNENQNLHDIFF